MTSETTNDNQEQGSSSSGKLIIILVILTILGFVIYQLTSSKDSHPPDTSKTSAHSEEVNENITPVTTAIPDQEEQATVEATAAGKATAELSEERDEAINNFLSDWKKAWQKSAGAEGNLDQYFSLYAESFSTANQNREQWKKSKTIRNQGKSWIEVWLSDIKIKESAPDQFEVTFKQEYSSSNYSDKSAKSMVLHKTKASFEILSEENM